MQNILGLMLCCKDTKGLFNSFTQYCMRDPEKYFSKKGFLDKYIELNDEEKEIFKSPKMFFDKLVELCYIQENKNRSYQNYPVCKRCGKETEFVSIGKGYKNYCCLECVKLTQEETCLNKYGSKKPFLSKEIQDKCKLTQSARTEEQQKEINKKREDYCLEKYGEKSVLSVPEIKEKIKDIMLEKYGVDNYAKTEDFKIKVDNVYDNKTNNEKQNILDKRIKTSNDRFGCDFHSQKHIKHKEDLNIDFIIENFSFNKLIDRNSVMEYFDISSTYYAKHLLPSIIEKGYKTKICWTKNEDKYIRMIEKNLGYSILKQYKIPGTRYKVDGFDPKTNTVYEFLGDYWHGNPDVYDLSDTNKNNKKTFKELYEKTKTRFEVITFLDYTVKYIWESEFKKIKQDKYL